MDSCAREGGTEEKEHTSKWQGKAESAPGGSQHKSKPDVSKQLKKENTHCPVYTNIHCLLLQVKETVCNEHFSTVTK